MVSDKKAVRYVDLDSPIPRQNVLIEFNLWNDHYIKGMTLSRDEGATNLEFTLLIVMFPNGKYLLTELYGS